jgi:predicted alpha/beta-hydrolase family hydrolase
MNLHVWIHRRKVEFPSAAGHNPAMPLVAAADRTAPLLVFGHGAGAGQRHPWVQRVADGFVSRGLSIYTFDFPYAAAGRRLPDTGAVLEAAFGAAWAEALRLAPSATGSFVGGKSMGGRIASQVLAARGFSPAPAGLICFGYPLHPRPTTAAPGPVSRVDRAPVIVPAQTRDRSLGDRCDRSSRGSPTRHSSSSRRRPLARTIATTVGSVEHALDVAARWMRSRSVPI